MNKDLDYKLIELLDEETEITHYAVNEYYTNIDKYLLYKEVANIYDDKFVIAKSKGLDADHFELSLKIDKKYGESSVFIAAISDYFDIDISDSATFNQLQCVENILLEAKDYYERTKKNKNLTLSVRLYDIEYYKSGLDNIDEMLELIRELKNKEVTKSTLR